MKIKKFEEFVNEGLISDYKAKQAESMKEISNSEKKFVLELMKALNDIEMASQLYGENSKLKMRIWSIEKHIDHTDDGTDGLENVSLEEALKKNYTDIPMTKKSKLTIESKGLHKEIYTKIYDWFKKKYKETLKGDPEFEGHMTVGFLLMIKDDIEKEIL